MRRSRILRFPRARLVAFAVGVGVIGSLATAPASFAATPAPGPAVGTACQTDGKISGRGSTFQNTAFQGNPAGTTTNPGFIKSYNIDVCGPVGTSTTLNTGWPTDPAGPDMVTLNYTGSQGGSGEGLMAMGCRTDLFGGSDLPYNSTEITAENGAPGSIATTLGETCAASAPVNPPFYATQTSFPVTGDTTNQMMSFPIAGGAVAIATNMNGVCPLPIPTNLNMTSQEFDRVMQGSVNSWADPSLLATNAPASTTPTATDVAQTLPGVTTLSGTTTNSGASAQTLPLTTAPGNLAVASTAGFPATGTLIVQSSTGVQTLAYTAIADATHFTIGTTAGSGTIAANTTVSLAVPVTTTASTLTVASTAGFSSTGGSFQVEGSSVLPNSATSQLSETLTVNYTGVSGNTLTGVTTTGGVTSANLTPGAVIAGVGTLTVSSLPSGFPTSGAVTVATGTGTATVRYTGVSGTTAPFTLTGVTTDAADSAASTAASAAVTPTSPLAGCTWGPIQRVVRHDLSGTTSIVKDGLWSVDSAALCDGTSTWASLSADASQNNTSWTQGCNSDVPTTVPTGNGSGALIAVLKTTSGGIGYSELGVWNQKNIPTTGFPGITFVNLETQDATNTNGISNNTPPAVTNGANTFQGPGSSSGSNCVPVINNIASPPASDPTSYVGLGTTGDWGISWSPTPASPNPAVSNITYKTTNYPLCGFTYDFLYKNTKNEAGEVSPTGSTLTVSGNSPYVGTRNDQLRTLFSFFLYVMTPAGQANLGANGYDALPNLWVSQIRSGIKANF
jgi:ABC-type phosphate transport system substrate-binding protein